MKKRIIIILTSLAGLVIIILAIVTIRRAQFQVPVSGQGEVLGLTNELSKQGIGILGLPVVSGDVIEASISGKRVIFSRDKDIISQVRALQLILPRLKMDTNIKEIDLRFNKVVLR